MLFESGKVTALGLPSPRIANEIFLKMMGIASANRISASVASQKRKSKERMARKTNEENACYVDSARQSKRRTSAKRIFKVIAEYMAKNEHLRGTPEFEMNLHSDIDRLLENLDSADDGRKRRKLVPAVAALSLGGSEEIVLSSGTLPPPPRNVC
jgi:hypothetical protein